MKVSQLKHHLVAALGIVWCGFIASAEVPATATWTGGGDREVLTDPANWSCKNAGGTVIPDAIPDASATAVTVMGNTSFNCPAGATRIWKSLTASGTVNLTADCDWRGAGPITDFVAANATINLAGHELFAKMPNNGKNALANKITVTDDSAQGAGGRFHIDVAEGERFSNYGGWDKENFFWFSGSLEIVKDGKGTYCLYSATKQTGFRYYTYTGGTTVHEGLLELNNDSEGTQNEDYYAQKESRRPVFGDYRTVKPFVRIDAGATIDYKGIYDISKYQTYMNGGTIKNTRKPANCSYAAFGDLIFEKDSFFDIARTAQQGGYFYLNGHTLTVNIATNQDWYCLNGSGANGTIIVTGDGTFHSYNSEIVAPTVNFDIATAISMEQPMTVSNYVARYEGASNAGTQTMTVLGTFKPVTQNFYPCTLKGEAYSRGGFPCIDLSEQTGAWNAVGTSGEVKFASQTVVTIDVGDRTLADGERIVAWSGAPQFAAFRIVGSQITPCEDPVADAEGLSYRLLPDSAVTRAEWTGAGARNDFADAANWRCWNCRGEGVPNGVPGAGASVYFMDAVNFDLADATARAKLDGYASFHFASTLALGTGCDWRGVTPNDRLFYDLKTLDLDGHDFKISGGDGVTAIDFTLTDTSAEGGTLVLDVAEGAAFENTKVQLDGSLRLQKTGEGHYIPHRYNQNYTGGNEIVAGTIKLYNDTTADSGAYSPKNTPNTRMLGKSPDSEDRTLIRVQTGATLDINGVYDIGRYLNPTYLNGGTLTTSKNMSKYSAGGMGNVTLEGDSFLTLADASMVIYGYGAINLGGHTLQATLGTGTSWAHLYVRDIAITNGTLVATGSGVFDTAGGEIDMTSTTLDLGTALCLNSTVVVSNYVARYAGAYVSAAKTFSVIGTLKMVADRCVGAVMKEGSVLDLSGRTTPQPLVTPLGTVTFDANATAITVDAGDRVLQPGDHLLSWNAKPADTVVFSLKGSNVEQGSELLSVRDFGLYYNLSPEMRIVTSARWTNALGDGDFANPANWTNCKDSDGNDVTGGVPGSSATVTFSGDLDVGVGTGAALPWLNVKFGSVKLTADCDWRTLSSFSDCVVENSTIDLNGHRLFVGQVGGGPAYTFTITDTTDAEHPGELHMDVGAGGTFTNYRITLAGNLRLVKEGAGTLIPKMYSLNYTGGNEIVAGTIKLFNDDVTDSSTYSMNNNKRPLGAEGRTLVVKAGATYDINGVYDTYKIPVELAGGTLKNTKNMAKNTWGALGNITLAADSTIVADVSTVLRGGDIDLNGHVLSVYLAVGKRLYVNAKIKNGTFCVTHGGYLQIDDGASVENVNLDAYAAMVVNKDVTVGDYAYRFPNGTSNSGSLEISVSGTFTPVTDHFYGCKLLDGSTIDLSTKTGTWSVTSDSKSHPTVTFADNATVMIDLGTRKVKSGEFVLSWKDTDRPSNLDSLKFKLKGARTGALVKKDGGLCFLRGMMIVFR